MLPIQILFEDQFLLVIHKPENIPFHSDDSSLGIVRLVRDQLNSESLFPIHRLDRMTSGLMVFAKTPDANEALSSMLANKQVEKYYLAIASGKPKKKQGLVKGDMAKSRRGSYKILRESTNPAITRFFARSIPVNNQNCWAFVLKPETGKTHQLRVALKSLGSPILGDSRYGGEVASRGFLHAYRMRFELFSKRYELVDNVLQSQELGFGDILGVYSELPKTESLGWGKSAFLLGS